MKEIIPYLNFDGNCREAMQFYAQCLGAELQLSPFSDVPGDTSQGDDKNRIMHARLTKGFTLLMASDTRSGIPLEPGNNFSVSIQCESLPEIEKLFAALAEKGQIGMPLQETFWGARFGMLTDQFGIRWMLNLDQPKQGSL